MQENETDNVLVSREWLEEMIGFIRCHTYEDDWARCILAMPDFIKSERDVEVVAKAIYLKDYPNGGSIYKTWESLPYQDHELYKRDAQAAINALAYRKEGE